MNKSSLTFVFIGISILTFILGSWQLYRLNWKNDLMDNIRNSILNPTLFSDDLTNKNIEERSKLGLSYVPQENSLFEELSLRQNLEIVVELKFKSIEKSKKKIEKIDFSAFFFILDPWLAIIDHLDL